MKNNINNTNDFNQIFIKLNKEEKKELFNSFIQEKKFEELIDNGYNFSKICDYLNDEQIETIYKLIEPKFNNNNFFKKIEDYYGVFSAVPSTKKESFFEKVKERFSESINNFIDFHHTMKILTTEQLTNLCPLLDKKLKEIFTTISAPVILSTPSQNLEKLLYDDELDKNKLKVLENYITIFFKSGADFEAFVKELDEEDTVILFDSFKNRISSIVDSDMDLAMIFFYLEEPQVKEACELLKDKINNIIKSGKELKTLLLRIPDEIRPVVIESLKDNVINKIEFSDELATLFNHLEEPEIKKICETGKNGLNKFIKSDHAKSADQQGCSYIGLGANLTSAFGLPFPRGPACGRRP